ncbi:MAG: hypothetical protein ACT4NL_05105 [Pseudomarimonas sp.]
MVSVPVSWLSRDGSARLDGVLVQDGGCLLLQYQTRDWHQGAQRSTARELKLNADSIVLVSYSAGPLWSSPRIEIQSSDFAALAALDADQSGHLRFRVRGSQRAAAKKLVQELNSALAEVRFSRWTRDMDRLAPTPPGSSDETST